jgi:hypothetical protein
MKLPLGFKRCRTMCVLGRESVCISLRVWGCSDMYWHVRRSQWPRDLRCGSATARLLGLRVRIPTKAWIIVVFGCCMMSGRGLCFGLTSRPEESYRVWCVQLAWSRSPVRGGYDPESGRRAIGKTRWHVEESMCWFCVWRKVGYQLIFCVATTHFGYSTHCWGL